MPRGAGTTSSLFRIKAYPIQRDDNGAWFIPARSPAQFIQFDMQTIDDVTYEDIEVQKGSQTLHLIHVSTEGVDYGINKSAYIAEPGGLMAAIFSLP